MVLVDFSLELEDSIKLGKIIGAMVTSSRSMEQRQLSWLWSSSSLVIVLEGIIVIIITTRVIKDIVGMNIGYMEDRCLVGSMV